MRAALENLATLALHFCFWLMFWSALLEVSQ